MFDKEFYQMGCIVLTLIALVLTIILVKSLKKGKNYSKDNTIPYPNDLELSGAAAKKGIVGVKNSPYYTSNDLYNAKSNKNLTILQKFKTYQQSTEYTCGPCCILMIMNYFGLTADEMEIAKICKTSETIGTDTQQIVNYFKTIGWNVQSSLDGKEGSLELIQENLKKGIPTMVEWVDLGGHWQVVIGYDTMGTEQEDDDVIIFADPYDTYDHNQDGYYVYPAQRFLSMWFDRDLLPENMKDKQWVSATPPGYK